MLLLEDVVLNLVPCFPDHYEVRQLYFDEVKAQVSNRLEPFMADMDSLLV